MAQKKTTLAQILQAGQEERETKYDYTIEQIMEIQEYEKQGKIHPLAAALPDIAGMRKRMNKYGKRLEESLMVENFPKYIRLQRKFILEDEILKVQDQIMAFREERMSNYRQIYREIPDAPFQMEVMHFEIYRSDTERMIYEEFIVPFVSD